MPEPRRLLIAALPALLLALVPALAPAQSGVAESQDYLRAAAAAQRDGDEAALIRALETARELNPASLFTQYNLARAYARNDMPEPALKLLADLARARVDFGAAGDEGFAALRDDPRFADILDELAAATAPVPGSELRYVVPRLDLVAEGITRDPATGRLFFGSMRTGEIVVFDRDGRLSKFAGIVHEGRPLAAIGMTVDSARGLLWVVGTAFFLTEGHDPGAPTVSGAFGFDLASGAERERYLRDDAGHGYNDLAVAADGTLYLTGAELGRLRPGRRAKIERLETAEPVYGSNGIVVSPDGRRLVVSAYPSGIAVIELADGATRFLAAPYGLTLYGIDGLYWHEGDLVGVQNGARPWRLMRFEVDDGLTRVVRARTIEFGTPDVPTNGAIEDGVMHYVAQEPAVDHPPAHLDEALHEYLGRTVIRSVALD